MAVVAMPEADWSADYQDLVAPHVAEVWEMASWLADGAAEAQELTCGALREVEREWWQAPLAGDLRTRLLKRLCDRHQGRCSGRGRRAGDVAPGSSPTPSSGAAPLPHGTAPLEAAVRALPGHLRLPLILGDIMGLPYREIASVLALPLGVVRSRIFEGRAHLHRPLAAMAPASSVGRHADGGQ